MVVLFSLSYNELITYALSLSTKTQTLFLGLSLRNQCFDIAKLQVWHWSGSQF